MNAGTGFRLERRGGTGVAPLVAAQLALVAAVLAFAWKPPAGVAVAPVAVVAVAAVLPGRDRRPIATTAARRWRLRRRRAAALSRGGRGGGTAAAALAELAPDLSVHTLPGPDAPLGVGHDHDGWFAAVEVLPPDGFRGDRLPSIDIGALARTLVETRLPVARFQLVVHTRRSLSPVGPDTPCAASYRELLGGTTVAAEQRCWVAVRIGAEAAANEFDGPAEAAQALRSAVGRARRTIARAGARPRVLDGDGLLAALASSWELAGVRAGPARERWSSWQAGGTAHACFWVSRWPPGAGSRVLPALASLPAVTTATALAIEPRGDGVAVTCLVRLSADARALEGATRRLAEGASRIGVRLGRLDGDHAGGVYATAPTAAEAP